MQHEINYFLVGQAVSPWLMVVLLAFLVKDIPGSMNVVGVPFRYFYQSS